jgi:hypothetical protein
MTSPQTAELKPRPKRSIIINIAARNQAIVNLYLAGNTFYGVGKQFQLSRARIRQIIIASGIRSRSYSETVQIRNSESEQEEPDAGPQTPITSFERALRQSPAIKGYKALSDDLQACVRRMFARHERACASLDIPVDPYFIDGAVFECKREEVRRERVNA